MRLRIAIPVLLAALAPVPAGSAAQKPPTTISVVSVSIGKPIETDKPPKGASKGDTIVFRDDLLNAQKQFGKPKGAKVGTDYGTLTFKSKKVAHFNGKAVLPGGTLTLKGQVFALQGGGMTIPVTAGTGRYEGAHGTLYVGPGDKQAPNVYKLSYGIAPVA
jgi:hypothetical protein